MDNAMQEPQDIVVTLVHGTFARDTEWTREDSALCKYLRENLSRNIRFDRFLWSGNNSYEDRQQAGKDLALELDRKIEAEADKYHFVIAHSHGGNVAIYAARDMAQGDKLDGIACLGTPFLAVSERDDIPVNKLRERIYSGLPTVIAAMASLILIWIIAIGAAALVAELVWSFMSENVATAVVVIVMFGTAIIAYKLFTRLIESYIKKPIQGYVDRLRKNRRDKATAFKATTSVTDLPTTNLLSLTYKWDEAGLYLKSLHQTTSIPLALSNLTLIILSILLLGFFLIFLFLSAPQWIPADTLVGFVESNDVKDNPLLANIKKYEMELILFFSALTLLVLIFTRVARITALYRSSSYGFGRLPRWMHEYLNIEPVSRPTLTMASHIHHEYEIAGSARKNTFRHNLIYDDPQALSKIADWMRQLMSEYTAKM